MILKIVTWNCNGAFRNKLHLLDEFDADIYVIQECENTEIAKKKFEAWMPNYLWKGNNLNKGLAVFAKSNLKLELLNWEDQGLELFLAVNVNGIQFIAIWTKYANSPTFQYIGQLWKYLQLHQDKIKEKPSILCGDWNSNTKWDVWDRWWNHSDVVNQLEKINIKSIYHLVRNEDQGKETQATFYMHRNVLKPFHIDYLFCSLELIDLSKSTCNLMNRDYWLKYSDHIPMQFNLKLIND
ncbi:endonuclease [Acinetobacter sp. NCu2D-2]|uniref:endonuclease/exonuclease/phosphatase family protein n=1 Tax=Acinetobacter sp. NCu2D-2 TaxID=1608473 RepID=UPI0007CDE904|nr:endonuclease/exonuclease/phosphatase family protein [Acinetobacter sp. NCu2D-2]ANF81478.1 endonuclease [Acinetobacter sp. NCu2D-2]